MVAMTRARAAGGGMQLAMGALPAHGGDAPNGAGKRAKAKVLVPTSPEQATAKIGAPIGGSNNVTAVASRAKRAKPAAAARSEPLADRPGAGGFMRAKERALYAAGYRCVVGVDEAGRGPLAGPVVAAACYIPPHVEIAGIADSKALSEAAREAIFEALLAHAEVRQAVSVQPPAVIDEVNILQATLLAMRECVAALRAQASELDYVLVDGNRTPYADGPPAGLSCETIVKGDAHCLSIAAASIIAKVTRDRLMVQMDLAHPQYEFKQHKGYPTAKHVALLFKHGPCVEHRRSFAPVRNALRETE